MNYLAHASLSFSNGHVLTGNMISDFVKGKKKFDYPPAVQNGIMLHRMIDAFTDAHPVTKEAAKVFKPVVGTYGGAFVDVVYDHFLANDTAEFPENSLEIFARDTYKTLTSLSSLMPEKFQQMLPYMISQNWLLNYRFKTGIYNSFNGIFHRAKYLEKNDNAFQCFNDNYDLLRKCYYQFFPQLKSFAFAQYNKFADERLF